MRTPSVPLAHPARPAIEPALAVPISPPRSRRAVLVGALGGIGALAATAIGGASRTQAAAGDPLILGSTTNNAGTSNTILTTNSSVVAFELIQNGAGTALMGYVTPSSGGTRGVYGRSDSPNGDGVQARNAGAAGTGAAVRAFGGNNIGLRATSDTASAVYAATAGFAGVEAVTTSGTGRAVYGFASATSASAAYGVNGITWTSNGAGVWGRSTAGSGTAAGVDGDAFSPNGFGVRGYNPTGIGVYGLTSTGKAVLGESLDLSGYGLYSAGNCHVAGTLSKSGGSFRIDHPLDPANRILQHSFVESPEMLNVYTGRVTADETGTATVTLPDWFGALNRDLRYQLTPVGAAMPDLHLKAELADGFAIAGAVPGGTVCWQLTGVRQDAWAEAHRIAVELDKPAGQRGRYLNPTEHGQPATRGIDYSEHRRVETRLPGPTDAPVGPS
jgi:hypothetical protein